MKTEIKLGIGLAALVIVIIVAFFVFGPSAPTDSDTTASREAAPVENRRVAVRDVPLSRPAVADGSANPAAPTATPAVPGTAAAPGAPAAADPLAASPTPSIAQPPAIAVGPSTQPSPAGLPGSGVTLVPTTQPAGPGGQATPPGITATDTARTPGTAAAEEPVNWRLLLAGATSPPNATGGATPTQPPGIAPPGSVRPGTSLGLPPLTGPNARSTPGEALARPDTGTYTVRPGDTLSSISNNLYGSPNFWSKIAQANPNVNPNRLRVGQVLVIPPESEVRASGAAASRGESAAERPSGSALVRDPQREYQVVSGDSLSKISQQLYGTPNRWREIYELNREQIGPSPTRLRVGMVLKLPAPPTSR